MPGDFRKAQYQHGQAGHQLRQAFKSLDHVAAYQKETEEKLGSIVRASAKAARCKPGSAGLKTQLDTIALEAARGSLANTRAIKEAKPALEQARRHIDQAHMGTRKIQEYDIKGDVCVARGWAPRSVRERDAYW